MDDGVEVAVDPAQLDIELMEPVHRSVRVRHRAGEDSDQRARHLDADRADDDALDPLLSRERGLRLHGRDLPDEREDERESADGSDERLADVDPCVDQVDDGRDVGFAGEKNHVRLQPFRGKLPGPGGMRKPSLLISASRSGAYSNENWVPWERPDSLWCPGARC